MNLENINEWKYTPELGLNDEYTLKDLSIWIKILSVRDNNECN